jgi:hypothetical protein
LEVGVQALNGFSGDVQISLSGVPAGLSANPAAPFAVPSGGSATLLLMAAPSAATGSSTIVVRGTSGALSHQKNINLTVQSGTSPAISRTTFARTDSQASFDDPPGEPHRRRAVYEPTGKHVFLANAANNRIEVLASTDASRVASVDLAGASSVELGADGKTIWAGTTAGEIVSIDTGSLQRTASLAIPAVEPLPHTVFDRPEEVVSLAGGKLILRMREANGTESLLTLYDPADGSLTDLTSLTPQLFQAGAGVVARSGDHSRMLAGSNDSSGSLAVFDGTGTVSTAPRSLGTGTVVYAAANADGSQFAVIFASGGSEQVLLLDANLNPVASRSTTFSGGILFSRDGQFVYVAENQNGFASITVLGASDLHEIGAVADPAIQGTTSEIEDADETAMVFGLNNRGASFLDASQPQNLSGSAPAVVSVPAVLPGAGQNSGGTSVTITGQNFAASPQVMFGRQPAASVPSSDATQIQATSPASAQTGATNVTAYFLNGGVALAADGFSYGPQVLKVIPNAGKSDGGESVAIYGYGFGDDPSKVSVKFGGVAGSLQKIEDVVSIAASLGFDASYPFPLQRLTLTSPAGAAGKADLTIVSSAGSTTTKQAYQFVKSEQTFAKAGFYKFILYDQKRQWVYLSNVDRVDVFDLTAGNFQNAILPPGGPPPNALIRQAALSPDGARLAIADFGAQSVYLTQPDTGIGTAVKTGGIAGDANSGPVRVALTSAGTVFVGLASYDSTTAACGSCLDQLDLSASPVTAAPAPQPQVATLTSAPLMEGSADGGAVAFSFGGAPGAPLAGWNAVTSGQFSSADSNIAPGDLAMSADGNAFAMRAEQSIEIRKSDLSLQAVARWAENERIPQRTEVPGIAMHASGALVYVPFLIGVPPADPSFAGLQSGVDILDAGTGRLRMRIMLPEPLAMNRADMDGWHARFMTVDEDGKRLFAITASGLSVVELARVPLGIGSLAPANGSVNGGTAVTIRGSGFQSGVTATLGGKRAAVNFVDMSTLKITTPALPGGAQRLVLTNPDGESFMLDVAFTAN